MGKLITFLDRLERAKLWYRLSKIRDSVLVLVSVPGEKWEVEFFDDGHIEIERYFSPGEIGDEEMLESLLREQDA